MSKKSPPRTNNNKNNDNAAEASDATEKTDEEDLTMKELLSLLNFSCHLNAILEKTDEVGASSVLKSDMEHFKSIENRMVNKILQMSITSGAAKKPVNNNEHGAGDEPEGGASGRTPRRLSSYGTSASAAYLSRNNAKTIADGEPAKVHGLHPRLQAKLDYVFQEGILDTLLPFIGPVPAPSKGSERAKMRFKEGPSLPVDKVSPVSPKGAEKDIAIAEGACADGGGAIPKINTRRKSQAGSSWKMPAADKKEQEVVLHVCDEMTNATRDFYCPQSLLASKMCYFQDVINAHKLEDMDISIHCDIQIFDWLMKWVKYNGDSEAGRGAVRAPPQLDGTNVVSILVSAYFLKMEPLQLDCLAYCHANLSEVVRISPNIGSLSEPIIVRLSAMFTNRELEAVRDKKERITHRLWMRLIDSLSDVEPETLRGHYFSLSTLFHCSKCGKYLTKTHQSYIRCIPIQTRLNRWGQLIIHHTPDATWNINVFVAALYKELKSWRRVYWRLWGLCHCLYCYICETHFQVNEMAWCRYHPEPANYLGPSTEGRLAGPAGRHPCCGKAAYRYETVPCSNGCAMREHVVQAETDRDRAILSIVGLAAEGNVLHEPTPMLVIPNPARADPQWNGLIIKPIRRQGMLPPLDPEEAKLRLARRVQVGLAPYFADSSSDTDNSETPAEGATAKGYTPAMGGELDTSSSSSNDGCESDVNTRRRPAKLAGTDGKGGAGRKKRRSGIPGRYWCNELSARSNQDQQREFEEKVIKQVIALINKKTGTERNLTLSAPTGGTYARLEAEWRKLRNENLGLIATRQHIINTFASNTSICNCNGGGARSKQK